MTGSFADIAHEVIKSPKEGPERSTKELVEPALDAVSSAHAAEPPRSQGFHISGLFDFCPREWALGGREGMIEGDPLAGEATGSLIPERFNAEKLLVFAIGHAFHRMLQDDILGKAGLLVGTWKKVNHDEYAEGPMPKEGVWQYVEPTIDIAIEGLPDDPRWHIVGHSDGRLAALGKIRLGEFKSCKSTIYPGLDKAFSGVARIRDWWAAGGANDRTWAEKYAKGHSFQLHCYLEGLGIDEGIVFYLPKEQPNDQPPMKEFLLERDPSVLETAKEKVRAYHAAWNEGDWQGPLPRKICSAAHCKRAQDCEVVNECFSV